MNTFMRLYLQQQKQLINQLIKPFRKLELDEMSYDDEETEINIDIFPYNWEAFQHNRKYRKEYYEEFEKLCEKIQKETNFCVLYDIDPSNSWQFIYINLNEVIKC